MILRPPSSPLFPYTTLFRSDSFCSTAVGKRGNQTTTSPTAVADPLPDEPNGYNGFQALFGHRSEEHTSELQSLRHLVCRLLLEKKNKKNTNIVTHTI